MWVRCASPLLVHVQLNGSYDGSTVAHVRSHCTLVVITTANKILKQLSALVVGKTGHPNHFRGCFWLMLPRNFVTLRNFTLSSKSFPVLIQTCIGASYIFKTATNHFSLSLFKWRSRRRKRWKGMWWKHTVSSNHWHAQSYRTSVFGKIWFEVQVLLYKLQTWAICTGSRLWDSILHDYYLSPAQCK